MDPFPSELWAAARAADHARVLRLARSTRGWTQTELASRAGYSPSAISRFEAGKRQISEVAKLRHLAAVLGLPPEAFGLNATAPSSTGVSPTFGDGRPNATGRPSDPRPFRVASAPLGPPGSTLVRVPITALTRSGPGTPRAMVQEEDDPVRRRAFLIAAGLTSASLGNAARSVPVGTGLDPAVILTGRLEDALTHANPVDAQPATITALRLALDDARGDFNASRYLTLADRLPALISTAEATVARAHGPARLDALAGTYNLVTRALIKLRKGGFEWVSADRALRAAQAGENGLIHAEAQRLMGSVLRRAGHHDRAQTVTLTAADSLDISDNAPAQHLALYGDLLCSAGYAAARAGDRHRAGDLLHEASTTADRLAHHPHLAKTLTANVISHQVSTAYLLGDACIAIERARAADLTSFPNPERQGRLLVDVALAYAQWDKPRHAYQALIAAERAAPQEVRTRTTVRDLVTTLLQGTSTILGLRQLARRVHVPL